MLFYDIVGSYEIVYFIVIILYLKREIIIIIIILIIFWENVKVRYEVVYF